MTIMRGVHTTTVQSDNNKPKGTHRDAGDTNETTFHMTQVSHRERNRVQGQAWGLRKRERQAWMHGGGDALN